MLYEKVRDDIRQLHMIEQGDRIVLGLSGGSDSVCLFHVLVRLKKELDFQLIAVHVHHGLRGEEADRDQRFVEKLCDQYEIPLNIYQADVAQLAKEWNMTVEEAGRAYRYQVFGQVSAEAGSGKIATAHHANDQAETLLFHLCRGTGIRGLGGIAPITKTDAGIIIRPLLSVTKEMVWNYLRENKLEYCTDSSNYTIDYTRNKIRKEVLPVMEEINTEAVFHMARTAALLRECDFFVKSLVQDFLQREMSVNELNQQPVFLQREIIKEAVVRAAGKAKDISAVHVEQVLQLCKGNTGKQIDLPYGITVIREYDKLEFVDREAVRESQKKRIEQEGALWDGIPITGEGIYELPGNRGTIQISVYPYQGQDFSNNEYTKTLDYDTIKQDLRIRFPMAGDRIVIDDKGNSKKLNRYFIDQKIERKKRGDSLLIAENQNIVWVIGGRIGNTYKISETTKQVIEIRYKGEANNG